MFKLTVLFALAPVSFAHANCPNLNGVFESKDHAQVLQISTQENDSGKSYQFGTGTGFVAADGKYHTAQSASGLSGRAKILCKNDGSILVVGHSENGFVSRFVVIPESENSLRVGGDAASSTLLNRR